MNTSDLVKTRKWQEKREKILRRDKYLDQFLFTRKGIVKPATIVHHILPKEKYPQYAWCDWNLISVSWDTHLKILHARNGELTKVGKQLLYETAFMNGVKLQNMILVIGLPESGKSTYVKRHLEDGLAYDLDYIASAFRLKRPKEEIHESSRTMANRLLKGFIVEAPKYNSEVYIIRTAPHEEELYNINPDKLVICEGGYKKRLENKYDLDIDQALAKIKFCEEWAVQNNVEVMHYRKEDYGKDTMEKGDNQGL